MRLLQRDDKGHWRLTKEYAREVPPYAILSHTWGDDEQEVTYQDIQKGTGLDKSGQVKLKFCADQAAKDGFDSVWVDTCCIDKSNSTELAEAINCMFRWYSDAAVCYVHLQDVVDRGSEDNTTGWMQSFRECRWLSRGWTLQELIAPKSVVIFDASGHQLGHKETLVDFLEETTNIPAAALRGEPLSTFLVEERLSWRCGRQTKRQEDRVYSMLGIFDVYLPLLYGEGERRAQSRLLEEVHKRSRGYYDGFAAADSKSHTSLSVLPMRPHGRSGNESSGQELRRKNDMNHLRDLFHTAEAQVQKFALEETRPLQSDMMFSQFGLDKSLFHQWGQELDLYSARDDGSEPEFVTDSTTAAAVRKIMERITSLMSTSANSTADQKQLSLSSKNNPSAPNRSVDVVQKASYVRAGQHLDDTQVTRSSLRQKMHFVAVAQQFHALIKELCDLTWRGPIDSVPLTHSAQFHAQKIAWEELQRQLQREWEADSTA